VAAIGLGVETSAADGSESITFEVAYVTGDASSPPQVWLASGDGRDRRHMGTGIQPLLSPDGSLIATSSTGTGGAALTLYSASGKVRRRYFNAARATATALAWSPDSRYLAVALGSTDPADDAASGLAVIDAGTLSETLVAHGPIDGASFAPDGSDRLAYASASSQALAARVDVHAVGPGATGASRVQLTHDGRSLNPVWGADGIAFDRERVRNAAEPAYQIWLMRPDGSDPQQLTHLRIPPLANGLVPIDVSGDGSRVLAEYEGQDTSEAWLLEPERRRARALTIGGEPVLGAAINAAGTAVLADRGGFLDPPSAGTVEALPLSDGGRARILVEHGAQPSWDS
jgi:hypothetical protein